MLTFVISDMKEKVQGSMRSNKVGGPVYTLGLSEGAFKPQAEGVKNMAN